VGGSKDNIESIVLFNAFGGRRLLIAQTEWSVL